MSYLQPGAYAPTYGGRHSLAADPSNERGLRSRPVSRKKFVLCFDGTGNKFQGDDSDSNILKIYRMLDRNDGSQFHYYQPGIGTYVSTTSLSNTSLPARFNSWYQKAKDSAIGTSFDQHVMGGYKFLMRYYSPGDDIYFFGFSRGAYIARFLAEMLDYVGLLSAGNEELTRFAWKTFARWQQRGDGNQEEKSQKKAMFEFMKAFRETFSRPVRRIRFLGLFDTVNSVPRFESAWMRRSKFPYTARSSAKVIRHAVSIDERRAKFRQDLISQGKISKTHRRFPHHSYLHKDSDQKCGRVAAADSSQPETYRRPSQAQPTIALTGVGVAVSPRTSLQGGLQENDVQAGNAPPSLHDQLDQDHASINTEHSQVSLQPPSRPDDDGSESDEETEQDIEEVWFPGCHADIGGGWGLADGEEYSLSHGPLVWMIRETQKAGLFFDPDKTVQMKCRDEYTFSAQGGNDRYISQPSNSAQPKNLAHVLRTAATRGRIHDCLELNNGLPRSSVMSWQIMEWMPFRRMDLQPDGSWKSISWPLPKGETRDIPRDAWIHNSALKRMEADENYRPGNLIVGGGGRGIRRAPKHLETGEWVVLKEEGDDTGEVHIRRSLHMEKSA